MSISVVGLLAVQIDKYLPIDFFKGFNHVALGLSLDGANHSQNVLE